MSPLFSSHDYLCPVSCVPNVASVPGLSSSCVLCAQCCQWPWIIFVLCLVCPMLPVVLEYLCPVSWVPNVASGPGLSNIWHTRHGMKTILEHWQHWAHKTQDKDNPGTLATLGAQDTRWRQSRDTGNIWHTRHAMKTIQAHRQHWAHKTVLCSQCCQCSWIIFVLCLVCPMLPVFQDCLHPVSCVPNVASVPGLSSFCVLCT
jgi:hypothetical protein